MTDEEANIIAEIWLDAVINKYLDEHSIDCDLTDIREVDEDE